MYETLERVQMESRKLIDGNIKVYLALSSLILALILSRCSQILAIFIFSALCIYADWRSYVKILRIPLFFLIGGILVLLFTIDGKAIFNFWILSATDKSLNVACSVLFRSLSSLSILSFLVITTSIPEFVSALSKLRVPSFLTEMLLLVYRAIQVLLDEVSRLDTAASSRLGYSSFMSFARTASLLAFSAFMKSVKRSEVMDEAMNTRCYCGEYPLLESENTGTALSLSILAAIIIAGWFG